MSATQATFSVIEPKALATILWGGLAAGFLDLTAALVRWGRPIRITQGMASGLLGPQAFQGGWGTTALGTGLHFFIAIDMFMAWIVRPRSAFPKTKAPFSLVGLMISLLTHMFCLGLPIALAVRRYSG